MLRAFLRPNSRNVFNHTLRPQHMRFFAQRVVSFRYTLTDTTGKVLDSNTNREQPHTYLEGASQIIPGLEDQLKNLETGFKGALFVPAKDAYGERTDEALVKIPIQSLGGRKFQVGDKVTVGDDPTPVPVIQITEEHLILDMNHALGGMDLTFDIEIVSCRSATEEEIQHGHAHGEHGHGHHH